MKKFIAFLIVTALLSWGVWFLVSGRLKRLMDGPGPYPSVTAAQADVSGAQEGVGAQSGEPSGGPAAAQTSVGRKGYFYEKLSDLQKQVYDQILAQIYDFPEKIKVEKIGEDDFNVIHHALLYDVPELFFVTNAAVMEFHSFTCYYKPEYSCAKEEYPAMLAAVERERDAVAAAVPDGADDYLKEKIVHDMLIASCSYGESERDSDIYGALVEHRAVCSGYAKATKYLLDSFGISNYLVSGEAISEGKRESHMWNTVYIDGKPYYLDVTWDDADTGNEPGYTYFNVTQAGVAVSHIPEEPTESGCVYLDQNYFVRENKYFTSWTDEDRAAYGDRLAETVAEGAVVFEVAFADEATRKQAVEDLIADQGIYELLRDCAERTQVELKTNIVNYSVEEERNVFHVDLTKNYGGDRSDG